MFVAFIGIVLTPVAHRVLHAFHLNEEDMEKPG